ncbi:MAG: MBL fold metallo-hydrolase [Legionellales bacterium]|nr:MBL fold metallo-hydrolase [Legionellales bacterium]|tara:strand:- start:2850 stop:3770 length:921 start_codon:yes stop_codon:yes gene_type:complete
MKYLILITLLSLTHLVIASDVNDDFNIVEVAEGNYLHKGVHVSVDDKHHDDIANIGFIIGNRCIAVVDTGGSIDIGMKLLKKIKSISDKPICYVINTHVHFDHILGNKAFVLDNPEFIGHENLGIEVERNRNFFLEQFKNDLGPNPSASSIIGPNVLIDKPTQLDLGDRIITLTPFPVSHSHSDLTIMDNRTSTLWAGDLIFRERIPSLTGSLIGWVKVMKELFNLKVELVIPGHGNVAESMTIAIKQQRDYLHRLLNETRNSIEEGQFINEAAENVDSENLSGWLLHDSQHPTNVSRAFNELEWE